MHFHTQKNFSHCNFMFIQSKAKNPQYTLLECEHPPTGMNKVK